MKWKGDRPRQQLLQLVSLTASFFTMTNNNGWKGLIPYYIFEDAPKISSHQQTGSSRGQFRRAHQIIEPRNFICASIKRNDPASRRLLQYLTMRSDSLLVLIRDAAVGGKILSSPPEDQKWLTRAKAGMGRASRNEWNIVAKVDTKWFEFVESHREWQFGFNEFYDVYIWDLIPGRHYSQLYNAIQDVSF